MAIDLLSLKPHKVSRDLSGYITYIYGIAKVGKTSLAARADKSLILAFEKGYGALDGVMAQDINSWAEMRSVMRELKKPEVQKQFKVLAIDTIDIAAKYCERYICADNGVDDLGSIPYGKGYKMMREEFEDVFASLTKLGYAIIFISHEQIRPITRDDGSTYDTVRPSLSPDKVNAIIENMADIYGYAHMKTVDDSGRKQRVLTLRDDTGMISCGCRFEYIVPETTFSYEGLTQAVCDAIDEQAKHGDKKMFVNEAPKFVETVKPSFDELKNEFDAIVKSLRETHPDDFATACAPKIVATTDKALGKGRKVAELTEDQYEQMEVVLGDMKEAFGL